MTLSWPMQENRRHIKPIIRIPFTINQQFYNLNLN